MRNIYNVYFVLALLMSSGMVLHAQDNDEVTIQLEGVEINPDEVRIALEEVVEEHPQLKVVAREAKKYLHKGAAKHMIKRHLKAICDKIHNMSQEDRKALWSKLSTRFPRVARKLKSIAKKHEKSLEEMGGATILPA